MNAGIAGAVGLSWLLAAHLNGWADVAILDAYEAERQPITQQVSHFVMDHAHAMAGQCGSVPENIEANDAAGAEARAALGQKAYDLNVQQYCCAGLNFGAFYDESPIIAYDGEEAPGYSMAAFEASTVPGCRAPHFWLKDGRSLYDALEPEFTLLLLVLDWWGGVAGPPWRWVCLCQCWKSRQVRPIRSMQRSWCWYAPTSTWPGAEMKRRTMRWACYGW